MSGFFARLNGWAVILLIVIASFLVSIGTSIYEALSAIDGSTEMLSTLTVGLLVTAIIMLLIWLVGRTTPASSAAGTPPPPPSPGRVAFNTWGWLLGAVPGALAITLATVSWGPESWTQLTGLGFSGVVKTVAGLIIAVAVAFGGYHYAKEGDRTWTKRAFVWVVTIILALAVLYTLLGEERTEKTFTVPQAAIQTAHDWAFSDNTPATGGVSIPDLKGITPPAKFFTGLVTGYPGATQWVLLIAILTMLMVVFWRGKPEHTSRFWGAVWLAAALGMGYAILKTDLPQAIWGYDWSSAGLGALLEQEIPGSSVWLKYTMSALTGLVAAMVIIKGLGGLITLINGPAPTSGGTGSSSAPTSRSSGVGGTVVALIIGLLIIGGGVAFLTTMGEWKYTGPESAEPTRPRTSGATSRCPTFAEVSDRWSIGGHLKGIFKAMATGEVGDKRHLLDHRESCYTAVKGGPGMLVWLEPGLREVQCRLAKDGQEDLVQSNFSFVYAERGPTPGSHLLSPVEFAFDRSGASKVVVYCKGVP